MGEPLVSVVMAASNTERFLGEAMESILGQTFADFELIVADFGSTDQSKEIASRYAARDQRVRLYDVPPSNLPAARNAACALARGRYLAVMDADDVALPGRLQWEVEFLESHPEVGFLGGGTEWIDTAGKALLLDSFPCLDREIREELPSRFPFCHPTVLMRRDAFLRVAGYRPAFAVSHDYDLVLRIAEHFQCANLPQTVLRYRIHPYQVSMRKRRLQTVCKLAAQGSAAARKAGKPDPLDGVSEITDATLARVGIDEKTLRNDLAYGVRHWIRHMRLVNENAVALEAGTEFLRTDLTDVEKWQIVDLYLAVASLYWRQGSFHCSLMAAAKALAMRPVVALRPLKALRGFQAETPSRSRLENTGANP
jgi:glycosyltransferase involved in cell wall biosynthesis